MLPTRLNPLFYCGGEVSPGCEGFEVPSGVAESAESRAEAFGRRCVLEPSGFGGLEDPRFGRVSGGAENPREQRLVARGNPGQHERTCRGRKASRRVKLAEADGLPFAAQGDRNAGASSLKGSP